MMTCAFFHFVAFLTVEFFSLSFFVRFLQDFRIIKINLEKIHHNVNDPSPFSFTYQIYLSGCWSSSQHSEVRRWYNQDRSPVCLRTNTERQHSHLVTIQNRHLTQLHYLHICGRKPQYPERTCKRILLIIIVLISTVL